MGRKRREESRKGTIKQRKRGKGRDDGERKSKRRKMETGRMMGRRNR